MRLFQYARACKGAATAELAVCLPFLLVGVVGVVDIGRVAYEALELQSAAYAGAQYGSFDQANARSTSQIIASATTELGADMAEKTSFAVDRYCLCGESDEIDCDTQTCPVGQPPAREHVSVQAAATFSTLLGYPGIPSTLALSRTVDMRVR